MTEAATAPLRIHKAPNSSTWLETNGTYVTVPIRNTENNEEK
jgi:hypothetical protein